MTGSVLLGHGSGGQLSHRLINELFVRHFDNPVLAEQGDAAICDMPAGRLALTTDSYVVQPLFFPGGDIGKLAVCGTINDLAVAGARPLYLTAGFILEEGLALETLERIVVSMAQTARQAGVPVVAGDTKVVGRGAADGVFINTAGVGSVPPGRQLTPANLRVGDILIVSGTLGDHGMAVLMQREGLQFESALESDCAALHELIEAALEAAPAGVRCMRDPTRGGLATTLNEWSAAGPGLEIDEEALPIRAEVRAISELLGLDPLHAANEGKVLLAVDPASATPVLAALRDHSLGRHAAIIGRITAEHPGRVVLRTPFGARRVIEMLAGAQLPRIC